MTEICVDFRKNRPCNKELIYEVDLTWAMDNVYWFIDISIFCKLYQLYHIYKTLLEITHLNIYEQIYIYIFININTSNPT